MMLQFFPEGFKDRKKCGKSWPERQDQVTFSLKISRFY
jgi:hypothetical protein